MQLEHFNGFPHMLTLVSGGLFHISILPADIGLDNLKEIVRWQVSANKLQSCLVLGASCCVYFDLDGAERISGDIPRAGSIAPAGCKRPGVAPAAASSACALSFFGRTSGNTVRVIWSTPN